MTPKKSPIESLFEHGSPEEEEMLEEFAKLVAEAVGYKPAPHELIVALMTDDTDEVVAIQVSVRLRYRGRYWFRHFEVELVSRQDEGVFFRVRELVPPFHIVPPADPDAASSYPKEVM